MEGTRCPPGPLLIHRTAPNPFDLTLFHPLHYLYNFVRPPPHTDPTTHYNSITSLSLSLSLCLQLPSQWEDHLVAIRMVSRRDLGLLKKIRNSSIISRKTDMGTGGLFLRMPVCLSSIIELMFFLSIQVLLFFCFLGGV